MVGVPPFYSLDHEEIYHGVLHEELTFPDKAILSNDIKGLLIGLLQKDPVKRLGGSHGIKEILIHPWVGRTNRCDIEQKKLKPPFLPDLANFNFDESDLEDRNKQTSKRIAEDLRCSSFETYFN